MYYKTLVTMLKHFQLTVLNYVLLAYVNRVRV